MITEQLEIHIDPMRRMKLDALAAYYGVSVSEIVQRLIDEAAAKREVDRAMRLRAVQNIADAMVEDVPDPAELKRQLGEAYASDLP